jgi:YHS domain-containing protein
MADLDQLRLQLARVVAESTRRRAVARAARALEMQELDARRRAFERIAGGWTTDLVVPRLHALSDALSQPGELEHVHGGCRARATLGHSKEFPVAASLTVTIEPGRSPRRARVHVEPRLIPMLVGHPPDATREFDLNLTDPTSLTGFLDGEIIVFVNHYLGVREPDSLYQRDSLARDPVCGATILRVDAVASHDFDGERYYFCAPACADRFRQDPAGFLSEYRTDPGPAPSRIQAGNAAAAVRGRPALILEAHALPSLGPVGAAMIGAEAESDGKGGVS